MSRSKARSRSKTRSRSGTNAQPRTGQDWVVQPGTTVYGSDGNRIGGVNDIQGAYLLVHKGGLFPKDHRIPFSVIASHTDDRIDLNVTADEATTTDWEQAAAPPETTTSTGSRTAPARPGRMTASGAKALAADQSGREAIATTVSGDPLPLDHRTPAANQSGESDAIVIPIVEEHLEASRHTVERGAIHIETTVSEHDETLTVPVTEERVHVQRIVVDRPATAADLSIQGRSIEVPVFGEEVDVHTRARVVEEVQISKAAMQETREISGTVRRKDIEIQDDGHLVDASPDDTTRRHR